MFKDTAGHEDLTAAIIGCGLRVHETWGPGLLEAIDKECLLIELKADGHDVNRSRKLHLMYKATT
jgi:GxxExxY protein